jgi:putative ABC transport system permease protein
MIRLTLKGLLSRKVRTALTMVAILSGVSMISGTYIITDALNHAFNTIFDQTHIDAVITGRSQIGSFDATPSMPASTLRKVAATPGVAAADGEMAGEAQLFDLRTHKPLNPTSHAPSLLFAVKNQKFNQLRLVKGHQPQGRQIALDTDAMRTDHLHLGETVGVASGSHALTTFRLVGATKFGQAGTVLGATLIEMSVPAAQRMTGEVGKYDQIAVMAQKGVTPKEIVRRIRRHLGHRIDHTVTVRTGEGQAKSAASQIAKALTFLKVALLAFAGIAVFVGAFLIFNTFSITVAQRTREFGLLRTVGATRLQILQSVVLESLLVGIFASVIGVGGGFLIAIGLTWLFTALGASFENIPYTLEPRTVVVGLLVGTVITVVAAFVPALRATRVPPIAALREGLDLPKGWFARAVPYIAIIVLSGGLGLTLIGIFAKIAGAGNRLAIIGGGCGLLFIGVATVSPTLVRPMAWVIGWPIERTARFTGLLGSENARRQPTRTAVTASALMIGLAIVVFVTIFANELKVTANDLIERDIAGTYIIEAANQDGVVPPAAVHRIAHMRGVTLLSAIKEDQGRITFPGGTRKTVIVDGVTPATIGRLYRYQWTAGSDADLRKLRHHGALVSDSFAVSHHLTVGSSLTILTTANRTGRFRVVAIFKASALVDSVMVSARSFAADWDQSSDNALVVDAANGVRVDKLENRIKRFLTRRYPTLTVLNQAQFKQQNDSRVDTLLYFLYVLLALSIIISVFGIVNTLILSIYERTREIGMLRAIGTTRRQARWMIRWESVITSLIGAILGILVGTGLALVITAGLQSQGIEYAVPVGELPVFLGLAVLVGIIAAALPARRAARLDILRALSYE